MLISLGEPWFSAFSENPRKTHRWRTPCEISFANRLCSSYQIPLIFCDKCGSVISAKCKYDFIVQIDATKDAISRDWKLRYPLLQQTHVRRLSRTDIACTMYCNSIRLLATKWESFDSRLFQMHYNERKYVLWLKFHWSLFLRVQSPSIRLDNSLAPTHICGTEEVVKCISYEPCMKCCAQMRPSVIWCLYSSDQTIIC